VQQLRHDLGAAVILTTHLMDEAEALCDRIAVLHQGRIGALGTPSDLKAAIAPGATLDDVFRALTGGGEQPEGGYRDVRQSRRGAIAHS
jgi:ABC-2 type transport system ATP-binding protein